MYVNMRKTHEVGPERPESAILRGLYIGSNPKLQDKTACICRCEGGWVVQVDDRANDFAFGWWKFPFEDWKQLPSKTAKALGIDWNER